MLHCVIVLSAGFIPTATKPCSAAIPFARSAVGPHATAPNDIHDDVDDVERQFQEMEGTQASATVENIKSRAPAEHAKKSAPVAALMEKHSFPLGLAQQAVASAKAFPIRFWIVDNSGSMGLPDGQKLAKDSTGTFKMIQATRWQELLKDIEDAGTLSQTVGSRTEFYPINPVDNPPLVVTGDGQSGEVAAVCAGLGAPHNGTPLAETTKRVADKIAGMVEQSLLMPGEKACVVIATDGEPNDKAAFKREVVRLAKLPVWLVFRLCTNDDNVVDYYNELDEQVEASIEVIDDLQGEAQEIAQAGNTFITYGPPMQLAREFGMKDQIFDVIDETKLLPSQIKTFCEALLGCPSLPEPELDPQAFLASIDEALALQPKVFDPISGEVQPWIKTDILKANLS